MVNYKITTSKLALVGLAGAITCILGPIAIALPFSPVPISLGLLGVFLSTSLLGPHLGTIACLVYLAIGIVGLPVFSGFTGGIGVVLGPTGGYLLGYLFVPLFSGLFTLRKRSARPLLLAGMLAGLLLCYLVGTLWLGHLLALDFYSALLVGVLPYIPADLIKLGVAWFLGNTIRKRLHKAGLLTTQ